MNNKFKRALSSILAFVMLCSCMCVMNVSSVLAATDYNNYYAKSTSSETVTWTFSSNGPNATLVEGDTILGIKYITASSSASKAETSQLTLRSGAVVQIPVPTDSTAGTIGATGISSASRYLRLSAVNSGRYLDSTSSNGSIASTISYTSNDIDDDGYITMYATGGDVKLKTLVLTDTSNTNVQKDTYTISGTSNLTTVGDTFTLKLANTSYEARLVNESGDWTLTNDVNEGSDAPFASGDTLTVSKKEYSANPSTVTLTATSVDKTFDAGAITFTKNELGYLEGKSYSASDIVAGLPNFDTDVTTNSNTDKMNNKQYIGFKLSQTATVTVNAKIGTGDASGKTATLFCADSKTATSGKIVCQLEAGVNKSFSDYTITLPAGTYYFICKSADTDFVAGSSSTSLQYSSITVAYTGDTYEEAPSNVFEIADVKLQDDTLYVIGKIATDKVDDDSTIDKVGLYIGKSLATSTTQKFETETVAEQVEDGEFDYTANGYYVAAWAFTGVTESSAVYVKPFTTYKDGKIGEGNAVKKAFEVSTAE